MASQERFGYEWDTYSALLPQYALQFSQWVAPLTRTDFMGKRVLDVGCGMGRNSYHALVWGASRVTAFDYDERSVAAARRTLAPFPSAEVKYESIFSIQYRDLYDIAMSIGVIHHLEDPEDAIRRMTDAVVPGGVVVIWVYSYEGNEWIVRFVDPVRIHITSRLPVGLVHALSYVVSAPLYLVARLFKGPGTYMRQLGTFSFKHVHSIVFDQLIPSIAHYWTKQEAAGLFNRDAFESVEVYRPPHGTGWTVVARKKKAAASRA